MDISTFFSQPIPEKLWHYTNLDAFEAILTSQRIWATEAHHTTDPEEFVHARQIARDYIDRLDALSSEAKRYKEAAGGLLEMAFGQEGPMSPEHHQVFVASFSSSKDKRTQWDRYGDEGAGVSLAFDLRNVRPPLEIKSGVTFAPCLYLDSEKESLIRDALSTWTAAREELWQRSSDTRRLAAWLNFQQTVDAIYGTSTTRDELLALKEREFKDLIRPAIIQSSFDLLRVASHCKAGRFLEEDEWRIALPHKVGSPLRHTQLQFRGPNRDIPYVAHNLFNFRLPIVEVVLSPRCPADLRVKAILAMSGFSIPTAESRLSGY